MDIEKLTQKTVEEGGILAILYFDLHANTKEALQQLGAGLVQKLLQEQGVVFALGEIDEPIENQGLFSTSVEVKILVKNLVLFAHICGDYSPFSIEILRPDEIKLSIDKAHDLLMNISINNYGLKKTMLEKVYRGEDLEKFKKVVLNRMELGKKILEKKDD